MDPTQIEVRNSYPAIVNGAPLYQRSFLETLDGISMQEYNSIFKGKIKDAIDTVRFDRLRIIGGTAVGTSDKSLFNVPLNGSGVTADGGTTYKKQRDDTNMRVASEMEYGNVLIVESLQAETIVTAQVATADTVNEVTDPTAAAIISSAISASLNLRTALVQSWLTFTVGDRIVLEGRLLDFPSSAGMSGFGGDLSEGFVQNGFGVGRYLREIVILRPGEQFGVTVNFPVSFTPTQDIDLVVKLCGVRLRPVG